MSNGKAIDPDSVVRYLEKSFGDALPQARSAMEHLASSKPPGELKERARTFYGLFAPQVEVGAAGWGQKGELDIDFIRSLADRHI